MQALGQCNEASGGGVAKEAGASRWVPSADECMRGRKAAGEPISKLPPSCRLKPIFYPSF